MGRPIGKKDSQKRKTKKTASKPSQKISPEQKPSFEPAKIEVTPYPRSGDNPEFVKMLDDLTNNQKPESPHSFSTQPGKVTNQSASAPLKEFDVAEIVGLPFLLWSNVNKLDSLRLSKDEKLSLSEPLCNILNRRDVGKYLNPDILDGIVLAGRLSPIMLYRFNLIQHAKEIREKSTGSPVKQQTEGKEKAANNVVNIKQGAEFKEPKEF